VSAYQISHDRNEESIESKVRWFKSLSITERMDMLCSFTDIALTLNPKILEKKNAQQIKGRVQIISES